MRGASNTLRSLRRRRRRVLSLSVALCVAWTACGGEGGGAAEPRVVSKAEAQALMQSGSPPLFLDVRTPGEYASGHVPGALLIPHDELPERMAEVQARRERLIVVYCERGPRALDALEHLREAGLEHVAELDGHMSAWRAADLPIER